MAFVDNPIESRSGCGCEGSFSTSFSFLDSFLKGRGEKEKSHQYRGKKASAANIG